MRDEIVKEFSAAAYGSTIASKTVLGQTASIIHNRVNEEEKAVLADSIDSWYETVPHSVGVLLPELSVLGRAAMLVSVDPVHQQDRHVDDVKVGQDVGEAAAEAVRQRSHKIPSVVHMSCHSPPARHK